MTRVLLVADDPAVARAAAQRLAAEEDCATEETASVADAMERLARERFDFVVIDRAGESLAVARKIEDRLAGDAQRPTLLVPTSAAFGLQSILASTVRHVRDLVATVANAIQFQLSMVPART